jgi:single-strand DNA-binding protein
MGRFCSDPELKQTQSGISVTSFTLAVDRSYCKQGQERQSDFINIVAWRGTAEFICKYFKKGSMIAAQGSIQTRTYTDKNGIKRKAFEIVADKVNFCGSKSDNTDDKCNKSTYKVAGSAPDIENDDSDNFGEISDDDLPF